MFSLEIIYFYIDHFLSFSSLSSELLLLISDQLCQRLVVLVLNPVFSHELRSHLRWVRVHWSYDYFLFTSDIYVDLKHWFVRTWRWLRWRARSWFSWASWIWLEGILLWIFVEINVITIEISFVIFIFSTGIVMEILPLIWVLALLFSVSGSKRALSVLLWWNLRLEWCFCACFLFVSCP